MPKVRMTKRLAEALEDNKKRFDELLRRPSDEFDRTLFWSYAISEREYANDSIRAMIAANIPERLIYIFDKTGFMVGKSAWRRLRKEERAEILRAGAEYDRLSIELNEPMYKSEDYEDFYSDADIPHLTNLYVLGNFIDRNINSGRLAQTTRNILVAFLTVRAYRLVRALYRMDKFSTAEERLILLRALYEIYCKIVYVLSTRQAAEHLLAVDLGVIVGTHELDFQPGGRKASKVRDKKTGKTYSRYLKFNELLDSSKLPSDLDLFPSLYGFLSSFVHSGSRHIRTMVKPDLAGLTLIHDDESMSVFVTALTTLISAMLMQQLLRLRKVSTVSVRDMRYFCTVVREISVEMFGKARSYDKSYLELFPLLRARASALPRRIRRTV